MKEAEPVGTSEGQEKWKCVNCWWWNKHGASMCERCGGLVEGGWMPNFDDPWWDKVWRWLLEFLATPPDGYHR